MQAIQRKPIYLYCVTKIKPDYSNFKDIGGKIYPIYSQGTYAIVGKVSPDEFSKEQHEKVIEEIMKDMTVLPFEFGTVFQEEEDVEKLLKERNTELKRIIANLDGKEEWALKTYCDLEKFKATLEKEDKRIKEKEQKIASAAKPAAYFLRKKKYKFIEDIVKEKIAEYTEDSFERLKRMCLETKIVKILPKEEKLEKKDNMVLNVAFLISKKRIREFKNVLEYLTTKYSNKGFIFDCKGPLLPYDFCFIKEEG